MCIFVGCIVLGAVAFDEPYGNTWIIGAIVGLVVGVIVTGVMFVQLQISENTIRVKNSLRDIVILLEEKTEQQSPKEPLAPNNQTTLREPQLKT